MFFYARKTRERAADHVHLCQSQIIQSSIQICISHESVSCRWPRLSAAPMHRAQIEHVELNHRGDLHREISTQIKLMQIYEMKITSKPQLESFFLCCWCCSMSSNNLQIDRDQHQSSQMTSCLAIAIFYLLDVPKNNNKMRKWTAINEQKPTIPLKSKIAIRFLGNLYVTSL